MIEKKFILFDFDGVIADSFQSAFEVQKIICPHVTELSYQKRFEGNIHDWQESMHVHTPECRLDLDFFDEYVLRMKTEIQIFPEMKEIVLRLAKDYNLIIISSTITSSVEEFLSRHNLASSFLKVMGCDVHKSKVEKIKMVFEEYSASAKNYIFITDTLGDILEAEKMAIESVAVTWGFHTAETLLRGKPFRVVERVNDLSLAINDYFKNLK